MKTRKETFFSRPKIVTLIILCLSIRLFVFPIVCQAQGISHGSWNGVKWRLLIGIKNTFSIRVDI